MADDFARAIDAFVQKCDVRLTKLFHGSLRGLDEAMAETTPVVSGNLRNSRAVSTLGPVTIDWTVKKFRNPDDAIDNAIAGAELGATVHLGYRAPYAHKVEPEHGFVRLPAQRWPAIVEEALRQAKSETGGG